MKTACLIALLIPSLLLAAEPECKSCCAAPKEAAAASSNSLYQLEARYTDDAGKALQLGEFAGQPVVITMFFSSCTYACPMLLGDLMRLRASLPEKDRGRVRFVLVSFDVERDTPKALKAFRESRQLGSDFALLHGDAGAVRELAAVLGIQYQRQPDGSFSHSNLITILDAKGEVVRQQAGLQGDMAPLAETAARL